MGSPPLALGITLRGSHINRNLKIICRSPVYFAGHYRINAFKYIKITPHVLSASAKNPPDPKRNLA